MDDNRQETLQDGRWQDGAPAERRHLKNRQQENQRFHKTMAQSKYNRFTDRGHGRLQQAALEEKSSSFFKYTGAESEQRTPNKRISHAPQIHRRLFNQPMEQWNPYNHL